LLLLWELFPGISSLGGGVFLPVLSKALVGGLLGAAIMEIFLIGGEIWQVIHWHSVILVLLEASANISQAVLNLKRAPKLS